MNMQTSIARYLATPSDFAPNEISAIADALNGILADSFALYLKTKNFHWHVAGRTSAIITCCSTSRPARSSR